MKKIFSFLAFAAFSVSAQTYSLPTLNYSFSDLEPSIDAKTMEIHYSKHHQAYVDNLNKAIGGTKMEKATLNDLMMYASFRPDAVRNNAGGHYNHSLFWKILAPKSQQKPISDELNSAISRELGGMDSLIIKMNQAASSRFGSGWAWLIVGTDKKLKITSTGNQDNPIMDVAKDRGIPILGIDVWEHAYYLKYQNKRGEYLNAIYEVMNWGVVSENYTAALNDPLLSSIEKDNWQELKDFHRVMGGTFHPAEKDDLAPLKKRSGELHAKAILLRNSKAPLSLQKPEIQAALHKLEEECAAIHKATSAKKVKDADLKKRIFQAHDTFHVIQGLCHD